MNISARIREAALGDAPGWPTLAEWLGYNFWCCDAVNELIESDGFAHAAEAHQRWILLLVAESLERP